MFASVATPTCAWRTIPITSSNLLKVEPAAHKAAPAEPAQGGPGRIRADPPESKTADRGEVHQPPNPEGVPGDMEHLPDEPGLQPLDPILQGSHPCEMYKGRESTGPAYISAAETAGAPLWAI